MIYQGIPVKLSLAKYFTGLRPHILMTTATVECVKPSLESYNRKANGAAAMRYGKTGMTMVSLSLTPFSPGQPLKVREGRAATQVREDAPESFLRRQDKTNRSRLT